jgi:hypothetical protein
MYNNNSSDESLLEKKLAEHYVVGSAGQVKATLLVKPPVWW